MRCSRTFGDTLTDPEMQVRLLGVDGDAAHLAIESHLATGSPSNPTGYTRTFCVRTLIKPGASRYRIVLAVKGALCSEPSYVVASAQSGGWQVVTTLSPQRRRWWEPPNVSDLVDWVAQNGYAIAVPVSNKEYERASYPLRTVPGLDGNSIVLEFA
jgi:hypothetical protein